MSSIKNKYFTYGIAFAIIKCKMQLTDCERKNDMRTLGTVVRGVRAPIFRQGDDAVAVTVETVLNALRENGIEAHDRDVVAITDSQMSPLYPLATAALLVRCEALAYVDSLAAPLSLMNALILAVGRRKRDEVAHVFSEMEQVWSKYSIFGKAEDE